MKPGVLEFKGSLSCQVISSDQKLQAKTINCKELTEEEGKYFSRSYSSRPPSSQRGFVVGPDSLERGVAEANAGAFYIKGWHTHTEEHAWSKRPTRKQTPPFVLRAGLSGSAVIREKSEGRGGRECAGDVMGGHICFIGLFEKGSVAVKEPEGVRQRRPSHQEMSLWWGYDGGTALLITKG